MNANMLFDKIINPNCKAYPYVTNKYLVKNKTETINFLDNLLLLNVKIPIDSITYDNLDMIVNINNYKALLYIIKNKNKILSYIYNFRILFLNDSDL